MSDKIMRSRILKSLSQGQETYFEETEDGRYCIWTNINVGKLCERTIKEEMLTKEEFEKRYPAA